MAAGRERRRTGFASVAALLAGALLLTGCGPGGLAWGAPSADALALAEDLGLTEDGRELFLAHRPALVDRPEVEAACLEHGLTGIRGCYVSGDTPAILMVDVPDERVHDAVLATAMWGLLMAAYERVDTFDRPGVDADVQAALDALPADHAVRVAVDEAAAANPLSARAQAFAELGSGLAEPVAPELERRYSRWLTDRVATATRAQAVWLMLDETAAELDAAWADQVAVEATNAAARAQLEADRAGLASTRDRYNAAVEEFNALTPDQRGRSSSSWTLWDGTVLAMQPTGDLLAAVRTHLLDAPAELDARQATLERAEADASAARDALTAREADLETMRAAVSPTTPTP